MSGIQLHHGDCLTILPTLADASVDAVVTDPPAGIAFMGKEWDSFGGRSNANAERDREAANRGPGAGLGNQPFGYSGSALPKSSVDRTQFVAFLTQALAECLRVAKPGARMLCWAIPRTSHWTGTAIEDAGWIIEDRVSHFFGQGFPKAKSKLKPACEDWWLARKPSKRVPELNIDACRIDLNGDDWKQTGTGGLWSHQRNGKTPKTPDESRNVKGRWPANVVLDEEAAAMLDAQSGILTSGQPIGTKNGGSLNCYGEFAGGIPVTGFGDSGGASRFFFCPKADRADRNAGCSGIQPKPLNWSNGEQSPGTFQAEGTNRRAANHHPTVKSTDLMRWLCRLITPDGGTILDPFTGSGSTGKAAKLEGYNFIGIEREAEYVEIARKRIAATDGCLFGGATPC